MGIIVACKANKVIYDLQRFDEKKKSCHQMSVKFYPTNQLFE